MDSSMPLQMMPQRRAPQPRYALANKFQVPQNPIRKQVTQDELRTSFAMLS